MSHKEGDLVVVEWNDASGLAHWQNQNDAYEDAGRGVCKCVTVGWITRFTGEALSIHASKSSRQLIGEVARSLSDQTKIPKECITGIRSLKIVERGKRVTK